MEQAATTAIRTSRWQRLRTRLRRCKYPQIVFARTIVERLRGVSGTISGSIVDIPCGDGDVTRELSRALTHRVIGIDISPECIDRANRATSGEDVKFAVADIYEYLAKEHDIAALCIVNSLFCLPDGRKALEAALAAVAPDGLVFVIVDNIRSTNYQAFRNRHPDYNKLELDEHQMIEFFHTIGFRVVSLMGVARARWYGRVRLRWMRSFRHPYLLAVDYALTILGRGTPSYFIFELAKGDAT